MAEECTDDINCRLHTVSGHVSPDCPRRAFLFLDACGLGKCCGVNDIHRPGCEKRAKYLLDANRRRAKDCCRWFRADTLITNHKKNFLSKRVWQLHIRYRDSERHMHHYMEFTNGSSARNAEQIIKFMIQAVNEQKERE